MKLIGRNDLPFQFRKLITRYRCIGYNLNVIRQSACLVFNPVMVDNFATYFNCPSVDRARLKSMHFSWFGLELLVCCFAHHGSTGVFLLLWIFSKLLGAQGSPSSGSLLNIMSPRFLLITVVILIYVFVLDDSLNS